MLSNKEKLEYYLSNNVEEVIDILINYKLLEVDIATPKSSDSLFSYENTEFAKQRASIIKKNVINSVECRHSTNSIKETNLETSKEIIVEDANEESEAESEPLMN